MKPQFLITKFLESDKKDEEFRQFLYSEGVLTKDYVDQGLILLYHKYESPITTDLERECRSLVIDRETRQIISYSCEVPRMNKDGMDYLLGHIDDKKIINQCYEGTYLSVFHHKDNWFVSTRRCLDSHDSVLNQGTKSHYEMLEEVLSMAGYKQFGDFTSNLNPLYSYYFVLIHHENKHIINYSNQFGEKYGRLVLTTIRDTEMNEVEISNDLTPFKNEIIFIPDVLESVDDFAANNKEFKYDTPENEGVVIRIFDSNVNKNRLIKLQYNAYQFAMIKGENENVFKGLLYLYQNGKLIEYFNDNAKAQQLKKIANPMNSSEVFDVVGMVDAVFKVCTSELFELFKILWSVKTGHHQNKELYDLLPKEYKDILFAIRGLYFKKKSTIYNLTNSGKEVTAVDIKNSHLKISDIYGHLKTGVSTEMFIAFLRMRRLMLNWVKMESSNTQLKEYGAVSKFCDKVHMKLCAIFTSKLFPTIVQNDIPPQKEEKKEDK